MTMMRLLTGWLVLALCTAGLAWATEPDDKDTKLSKDEQLILELTNEARAKEKLPPLKANATLLRVARAHSANMAKQQKMEHDLDGKTPAQRIEDAGYDYKSMGENIAEGDKPVSIRMIFKGWMDSPGHREHILSPKFDEIGIGIASDKGKRYYTQVFGK